MARPSVNIALSNGGLDLLPPSDNGTSVVMIASPVAPAAGYGVAFLVRTKVQAATAFGQAGNEDVLSAIVDGFFAEAPEGTKLYCCCMAPTTTLTVLADPANAGKPLTMAAGAARLVAFIKFPGAAYEPTPEGGFDGDVHTAVTAAQALANTWFARKMPFRYLIEGFGFTSVADAKDYNVEIPVPNRNGFIVAGAINNSTALETMLVLGSAAKVEPQRHPGRIKDGSLNIAETAVVSLGGFVIDNVPDIDLDTLNEKRYITLERNKIASGYVISDDPALVVETDDFNNLRYGRIIDNAVRVAFQTYYRELKDDVDVTEGGRLSAVAEKALQSAIEDAIDTTMRPQLSKNNDGTAAVTCYVNPDPTDYAALYENAGITNPNFNLLQTGTVYLFVRMRPKGCIKELDVFLGYTA